MRRRQRVAVRRYLGNIRTQTLRAFTSVEMEKILANIP
jgi:uncharacterized protein with GYD domain